MVRVAKSRCRVGLYDRPDHQAKSVAISSFPDILALASAMKKSQKSTDSMTDAFPAPLTVMEHVPTAKSDIAHVAQHDAVNPQHDVSRAHPSPSPIVLRNHTFSTAAARMAEEIENRFRARQHARILIAAPFPEKPNSKTTISDSTADADHTPACIDNQMKMKSDQKSQPNLSAPCKSFPLKKTKKDDEDGNNGGNASITSTLAFGPALTFRELFTFENAKKDQEYDGNSRSKVSRAPTFPFGYDDPGSCDPAPFKNTEKKFEDIWDTDSDASSTCFELTFGQDTFIDRLQIESKNLISVYLLPWL